METLIIFYYTNNFIMYSSKIFINMFTQNRKKIYKIWQDATTLPIFYNLFLSL